MKNYFLAICLFCMAQPAFSVGVGADCSEKKTSMGELEDIAKNSSNVLDFLKKIPEGTLQGFTFVTNSLSLHRGEKDKDGNGQVSPMWPRVLRTSVDGKITVSFVCDPKNPTHKKVEIIHFDDKTNEFKTTEFDFAHPKEKRIHQNPESCISCHAGSEINGRSSIKPNWPQYFQWSDKNIEGIQVYGGNDDNMKPGITRLTSGYGRDVSEKDKKDESYKKDIEAITTEQNNYLKFKDTQKNNECFNTLPWIKNPPKKEKNKSWAYDYYPYSEAAQEKVGDPESNNAIFNLSLRTNLRITNMYSLLLAKQTAKKIIDSPDYDKIKYLIASERYCYASEEHVAQLKKIIPKFEVIDLKKDIETRKKEDSSILRRYSYLSGMSPQDWTMKFLEKKSAAYTSALPGNSRYAGSNLDIASSVGDEVLNDIAESDPQIKEIISGIDKANGFVENYGSRFSCLDNVSNPLLFSTPAWERNIKKEKLCDALKSEHEKNLKKYEALIDQENKTGSCNEPEDVQNKSLNLAGTVQKVIVKFDQDQIERGKKLVEADSKGKCVSCHSSGAGMLPKDYLFVPGEHDKNKAESVAILKARKDEIADKIEERLIKKKTMPPMENSLTAQDREDIKSYLLSVAQGM